jgi:hypothetical protein
LPVEPTQITAAPLNSAALTLPPADEATQRLSVPDGFAIRIFADNIPGTPRFMAVGEDGELYVSLYGSGEIARLPDSDRDGLVDGIEIIAGGAQ